MKRRILSILTALALCLSLLPTWALALTEGNFGDGLYWSINDGEGDHGGAVEAELKISGSGPMPSFEGTPPWSEYRQYITSAIIEDGVTSIGDKAFYNTPKLESVTIGKDVTSIGNSAFYNCSRLTSVTIPDNVTSIDAFTFCGCSSLESVTIGNGVTSIGDNAFDACSRLTSVTIPGSVTLIGAEAFGWCFDLTEVTFEGPVPELHLSDDEEPIFDPSDFTVHVPHGTQGAYEACKAVLFPDATIVESPEHIWVNNQCVCGAVAVAKVEKDGEPTTYLTQEALQETFGGNNDESNFTLTLLDNVTLEGDSLTFRGENVTLDCGGYTLTGSDAAPVINTHGDLTVQHGTVKSKYIGVNISGGSAVIDGVDISSDGTGLVVDSGATATLVSGTISGNENAIQVAGELTLAAGSTAMLGGEPLTFPLTGEYSGPGKVTVEPCTHPEIKATPNNDGTHSLECPVCGYSAEEECSYGEYQHDDTDHWKTCTVCDGTTALKAHDDWATWSDINGNVTTNHKKCQTCQYTMDPVTVTVHVPDGLVYGQTGGKQLTCTVEPAQEGGSAVWSWKDNDRDTPQLEPDGTLPAGLPAGNYVATVTVTTEKETVYGQAGFTVAQSGTEFTGGVTVWKGDQQTNAFSAGDTITVKATPKATGTASANAAMMTASLAAPSAGQMAVYYNNQQISAPAEPDENGVCTMTVNTGDLPPEALNKEITLAVKFIEDDNMAGAEGIVKVTVKAEASVTIGETTTCYATVTDAWNALNGTSESDPGTVTLLQSVTVGSMLYVGSNKYVTVEMAEGVTLTSTADCFYVSEGSLTLTGSCTVTAKTGAVVTAASGTLRVTGGKYTGVDGIEAQSWANIKLSGGTITASRTVLSYGNSYIGEMLEDGYDFFDENGKFADIGFYNGYGDGTYTVKKCEHNYSVIDLGDGEHGEACVICGYVPDSDETEPHAFDQSGTCTVCDAKAALLMTIGGDSTYYSTLEDVSDALSETGYNEEEDSYNVTATITLLADLNADDYLAVKGGMDVTLESNKNEAGEDYRITDEYSVFYVAGGTLTITGGKYTSNNGYILALGWEGATVSLSGGTFGGGKGLIDPYDYYGSITIPTLGELLAEGYAYFRDGQPIGGILDSRDPLTGTVTVAKCEHKGVDTPTSNNNGTHGLNCPYCGHTGTPEKCPYAFIENEGTCPTCRDALTVLVKGTDGLIYDGTEKTPGVMVMRGETELTEGYTVTYDNNKNAGTNTASVTITVGGGTYTKTFSIAKSTPTIAFVSGYTLDKTYDGQTIADPTATDMKITGASYENVTFKWSGTPLDAGTYTITATIPETDNTTKAEATLTVTISRKSVTPDVTITPGSYEYTGSAIRPSGSAVKVMDGTDEIPASEYTLSYGENIHVGTGTVIVTNTGSGNYSFTAVTKTFEITKLSLETAAVKLSGGPYTYDGTAKTPAITVTKGTSTVDADEYVVSYTNSNGGPGDHTNAGTVAVKVTATTDGNYSGSASTTFTIGKKELTPAITGTTAKTYDGTDAAPAGLSITLDGKVGGDDVTATASFAYDSPNAGVNKTITASGITLSGADAENYTLSDPTATIQGTITKADQDTPAAPTAEDANIKDSSITLTAIDGAEYRMGEDGEWKDSPIFTGLEPNHTYTFYARLKGDDNHNPSPASEASITTKKTMLNDAVVTVSGTYTYDGTAQVPSAEQVTAKLNGTVIPSGQYTISADRNINAGEATVTITATADGDYSGSASGKFTIAQAPLTITANNQTITYGESIAQGTDQVDATGLCNGDSLDSITLDPSTENVPGGTITPSNAVIKNSGEDVTGNYKITYQNGALTINKADVTITPPAAQNLTYTGAPQALVEAGTANVGDVVYSLTETGQYSTTVPTATNAGNYTVWYKVDGNDNYNGVAPVSVAVTIARKQVTPTVTIDPNSYEYTGSVIQPSGSAVKVLDGTDEIPVSEYTLSYGENIHVGTGTVTVKDNGVGNYEITETSQDFTITKPSLETATMNLSPTSYTYDGTPKTPTATVTKGSSPVDANEYVISYSNTNGGAGNHTNAGTVTVTVTAKENGNYSGSCSAEFIIDPAPLTPVITGTTTKTYDGTNAAPAGLSITLDGKVGNDDVTATVTSYKYDAADAGQRTITASGITLDGTSKNNYTLSRTTATITGTITKATVSVTWGSATQTKTYTGKAAEITAPTVSAENGLTVSVAPKYSYAVQSNSDFKDGLPTDAGTYTVRASTVEDGNLTAASADMTLTINKATLTITGATVTPKPYEAGNTTATVSSVTFSGLVNSETLTIDTDYTATGTFADANIGTNKNVNVTVTLNATAKANNYTLDNGSYTATGEIQPISISTATVTLSPSSFTYTGDAQVPDVTVKLGDDELTAGTDYTITYSSDCINAGNITVTVTGKNNYGGTVSSQYTIQPATLTPSLGGTVSKTYDGTTAAPAGLSINLSGILKSDNVTAAAGSSTYAGANVGTWTITASGITLSGTAAGNYTLSTTTATIEGTITQADAPAAKGGTMTVSNDLERTYSYTLDQLLPDLTEGKTFGSVTYKLGTVDLGDYYDTGAAIADNKLSLPIKAVETNDEKVIGTIQITISSTNFKDITATITVSSVDKITPEGTPTASPSTITYGQPISTVTLSGEMHDGTGSVDGKFTWDDPNVTPDAGTYQAAWTFTPTDTGRYTSVTGTVTITVLKATPSLSLTASPATLPNGGTVTLTLSGLPAGGSATVTCDHENISVTKGTGNTWTADLPAGGASYTFTASYAGDGNHNSATANCTVSVEKITPTLSLTAAPDSLTGSGMVTLTLSGLPAGGSATVTCSDESISITPGMGSTWTAPLPNSTAIYTFTASYAGNDSYNAASAICHVAVVAVTIIEDGEDERVIMTEGITEVPDGLKDIPELNTIDKLDAAMRAAITEISSGVSQSNTAVYDVVLQISKDGGNTWVTATKDNFPEGGLTITLPYPAGTDSSYKFTVVHMFTTSDFGKQPGDTETFTADQVKNTANGIQVVVTGLSPISVGWEKSSTPSIPTGPSISSPGTGVSTYAITIEKSEHGKVTSNRTNASNGSTVTLTATPDRGYVLDTLTVTDSRGNEIKLTAQGSGKYIFTMPSRAVTVKATFAPLPADVEQPCDGGVSCPSYGFADLGTVGTWYHEAVDYALRNGLMNGYNSTMFGPNDNLSRAQLAQILYNMEGKPAVTGSSTFADVVSGQWYAPAITWAAANGIVGGYGNGRFGPDDNITREQLAVMLWRYARSPAATDKELHFTDADEAGGWALEALRWAAENGILNGYGDGRLNPGGLATRAQVAQMLKNFIEN